MAAPAVATAVKVGAKILSHLVDTDDIKRIVGFFVALVLGFVLLVVMLPMLFLSIPFASANQTSPYIQVTQQVYKTKGVMVSWEELIAIDAVRYAQNFQRTNIAEITQLAEQFLAAHNQSVQDCQGTGSTKQCRQITNITYTVRPLAEVMDQLGFDAKQQQQVRHIVTTLTSRAVRWSSDEQTEGVYQWMPIIIQEAQRAGIDPALVAAIMSVESGGDPNAVSPVGAEGVMQMMPDTAAEWGVSDPYNAAEEIRGATNMLASLYSQYHGDITLIAAAYNAGPDAVRNYGGVPPYQETQDYVVKVATAYQYFSTHPTASK